MFQFLKAFNVKRYLLQKLLTSINTNLYAHVEKLSGIIGERNSVKYDELLQTRDYIFNMMKESSFHCTSSPYSDDNLTYYNLVAEKTGSTQPSEIIVIGSHYDSVQGSPGADDNASGIATLLELIRLLNKYENKRTLRFVAFALEEPPFYNTPWMGSYIHAKKCKDKDEHIFSMIALEMLGYFSNKPHTQKYPTDVLQQRFNDRGNFISVVGNVNSKMIVKKTANTFKNISLVPVIPLITYDFIPGTNLSDHAPFWELGYKAIMITDTAFYRNPHYHQPTDTIDKLDFDIFSKVVYSLFQAIKELDVMNESEIAPRPSV